MLFRFKWKPLRQYMKAQKLYKKAEKRGELMDVPFNVLFTRFQKAAIIVSTMGLKPSPSGETFRIRLGLDKLADYGTLSNQFAQSF